MTDFKWIYLKPRIAGVTVSLICAFLSACGSSSDSEESAFEIISIAYISRANAVLTGTNPTQYAPGGDVFIVPSSDTSGSQANNVTAAVSGAEGDVSSLDISADGKRLLFSMKRNPQESWNLWEYDITTQTATPILVDDTGDDIEAKYLYDGRIVFTSNRQTRRAEVLRRNAIEPFVIAEEYGNEALLSLHTINADGTNLQQISFSPSHERTPTPLNNGRILFSRWDHLGPKNRHNLYSVASNGTDMRLEYGAFSAGNSRLYASQLPDGQLVSTTLAAGSSGGALFAIDIKQFTEALKPDPFLFSSSQLATGTLIGQQEVSQQAIAISGDPSGTGSYHQLFPLFDGTNRLLTAFSITTLSNGADPINGRIRTNSLQQANSRLITMVDLNNGSSRPMALPEAGKALSSPVAIMAKTITAQTYSLNSEGDTSSAPDPLPITSSTMGSIHVWSSYDTDANNLARLSNEQLNATDPVIPSQAPTITDTRTLVANIPALKALPPNERAARFVRVIQSVPTPVGFSRSIIGKTPYEMRALVGYGTVEPDGSFAFKVPADTPITVQVLDAQGRSIAPHYGWLQVRPNEDLSCKGCHSPRRGGSLNSASVRATTSSTNNPLTQAQSRSLVANGNLDSLGLTLTQDIEFWDFWEEDSLAAAKANGTFTSITYDNTPATFGSTLAETDEILGRLESGTLNYPEHVQPVWDAVRGTLNPNTGKGTETCSGCHSTANLGGAAAGLDLSRGLEANGRMRSYEQLIAGGTVFTNNIPALTSSDNVYSISNQKNLVYPGSSRQSHLTEVIYNSELNADGPNEELAKTRAPDTALDHSAILTDSDYRIINEWIDLGAQYYNSPYIEGAELSVEAGFVFSQAELVNADIQLDQSEYENGIHAYLNDNCASCHRAIGSNDVAPNSTADAADPSGVAKELRVKHNFVLTGDAQTDFFSTASMVNTLDQLDSNPILLRPSYSGGVAILVHPLKANTDNNNNQAFLEKDSEDYLRIRNWIQAAQ